MSLNEIFDRPELHRANSTTRPLHFLQHSAEASDDSFVKPSALNSHEPKRVPIRELRARERFIIEPNKSSWLPFWDSVSFLAMLYTAIVTPYEVALLPPTGGCITSLFVVNRIVDLVFYTDMVITFRLAYFNERSGRWVRNGTDIAKNYLLGFFFSDLLSLLPLWPLAAASGCSTADGGRGSGGSGGGGDAHLRLTDSSRLFRLLRLLRLTRMFKASRVLGSSLRDILMNHLGATFATLQLAQLVILLCVFSHWQACAFALVEIFAFDEESATWLRQQEAVGMVDGSPFESYVAALYFSVSIVTGIGSEVNPVNSSERLLVCGLKLLSGSLWAFGIGSAASIVTTLNPNKVVFRNSMDKLTLFMRERQLPWNLRMMTRDYFENARHVHQVASCSATRPCAAATAAAAAAAAAHSSSFAAAIPAAGLRA